MKKILSIFLLLTIFVYACAQKTEVRKPSETQSQPTETQATGDVTTDSFGNDMSNANNEDKELSSSELEGIDSGFSDVENI